MILIVDDNRENVYSLMRLLEGSGFPTDPAYSGEEALKKALKTDYSLAILDVQIPQMDGFEVATALAGNSKTKDIPIIFLSAVNTDKKFITQGYASGGIDYITKPFDPDILLLKIKTFQRLYQQHQDLQRTQQDLRQEIEIRKKAEAQKDAFVSMASHELKTPLTSLKGYLQMLDRMYDSLDKPTITGFIGSANKQVNKLNLLITELLDITQIENGSLKFNYAPFDFNCLVSHTVDMMQQIHTDKEISIASNIPVKVNGDALRIEQVLINYLSNAAKYSPEQKEITVSSERKDGFVKLTVKDRGIGIPADKQDRVFSKFFRVEEASERFQGIGIGLYICAEIIGRHNGQYGVESEPGKGSSFYFLLPLHNEQESTN
jgi:two-component system sensor histidine kinase/response regulator